MKIIKKQFEIRCEKNRYVETITKEVVVNSQEQTFKEFMKSDYIWGYDFTDKKKNRLIYKFELFYLDLTVEQMKQRFNKTHYEPHKENSPRWKNGILTIIN